MTAPLNTARDSGLAAQRQFRKHKVLPRPHSDTGHDPVHISRDGPKSFDLTIDTTRPVAREDSSRNRGAQPSSPRTLKHHSKRIGRGPDLPPTPPRHSRKSSSTSSGPPASPTFADSAFRTPKNLALLPPSTPPNQRSPPTPDVTPPQPTNRPAMLRPALGDRAASKATTTGSHTGSGSFKTAREEASSEDEEKTSAVTKASRSTVRHVPEKKNAIPTKLTGLGLAIASLAPLDDNNLSLSGGEFSSFDGDWSSISEVEQEWDNNLMRMVTIKKRPQVLEPIRPVSQAAIVVDPAMVSPTQATKAVRHMPLHKRADTVSSSRGVSDRATTSTAPSSTATSISSDARRTSAISTKSAKSTKSTVSTVVEAVLIDGPPQPHRQRTLRHVRKQGTLRGPTNVSPRPTVNAPNAVKTERPLVRESRPRTRPQDGKRESSVSTTSVPPISSNKARREIWKNGGIPVVIVPDRRSSSTKSRSREPSLRSCSSRRTPSVGSVPRDSSSSSSTKGSREVKDGETVSSRQSRPRRRTYSESDGSDQRTIDFPPVIPARSSSLSAPTSRNTSRAASLTAESIKLHNALQESLMKKSKELKASKEESQLPVLRLPDEQPAPARSIESDRDGTHRRLSSDRHSDFLNVKSYGSLKTPFSLASVETHGTALEVSEAMAIQMYPHQNSSVLMVDHSAKPSESSLETQVEPKTSQLSSGKKTAESLHGDVPVTPPQPQFSLDDVDSPLRNPRAPPEPPSHPPAINFIPATPSGMTPAVEKMAHVGNYFETMKEKPPSRRPSIVRRALNRRRRHSIDYPPSASRGPGLLSRTMSLSRHIRNSYAGSSRDQDYPETERNTMYPNPDDEPAEEDRLHPYWRPQGYCEDDECDENCHHGDDMDDGAEDEYYRYPPVNNRPSRNLSSRVKRTFAILPQEDDYYYADDWQGPERRTIRRTPSGNLRVMRHRASFESLRRNYKNDGETNVGPDTEDRRPFWRRNSIHRRASKERRRLSLGSKLEEIQNLPRKFSEKRREKRTRELRQKISGPREVRDGVGEVIRSTPLRDQFNPSG